MNFDPDVIETSSHGFLRRFVEFWALSAVDRTSYKPIVLKDIDQVDDKLSTVELNGRQKHLLDIQLSGKLVHTRHLGLPRTTRKKAFQVLQLHADAFGKSKNSLMLHRSVRVATVGQTDKYHQIFTRKTDISHLEARAKNLGIGIGSIFCVSAGKRVYFREAPGVSKKTTLIWWLSGLVVVNLYLGAVFLAAADAHTNIKETILLVNQDAAQLRSTLSEDQTRILEISAENQRIQSQALSFGNGLKTTKLLAFLTKRLPSEAWLTNLILNENNLHLSGRTTGDPLRLIENLEAEPWIVDITVESPLQRDPYNSQTLFDLMLTIDRSRL